MTSGISLSSANALSEIAGELCERLMVVVKSIKVWSLSSSDFLDLGDKLQPDDADSSSDTASVDTCHRYY